ncbi:MAG: endopeptidase La [Acidobacteria bacterium]|nr:endopeptidase La [Acidobacteriota bacterium]
MSNEPLHLPVIPLRDVVIFPGVKTVISAGRPGTLKAIRRAAKSDEKLVFAVSQRVNVDEAAPETLHTIGTIARIGQLQRFAGGVQLLLEGDRRGIAMRIAEKDDHLEAVVRPAEEMWPADTDDPAFLGLQREVRERAAELAQKAGLPPDIVSDILAGLEDGARLADQVASHLELGAGDKQMLLETLSVEDRLRRVLVHVQRQIAVFDAQSDIKSRVQQELGDRQREMVLREQLKAIQQELGEGDEDGDALDELRDTLRNLELNETARKEVDRELRRLTRLNKESMEYQVARGFLEVIAELPWNERSDEDVDLLRAAEILDADHYALGDVKDRVLEFLAVSRLHAQREAREAALAKEAAAGVEDEEAAETEAAPVAPAVAGEDVTKKAPILLFVGPPGVGKTSIARSIARATGREYVRVALGGARDEADIRGHRRTYVGAMPGRIIQGMRQAGKRNPLFLLDEVDKLGASFQGDPASALLEVLDPAQNHTFVDHYLGLPFDLSEVLFVATANFVRQIPAPLLDRMEVVEFSGYTEAEKLEIARRYLVPRQLQEKALTEEQLTIEDTAIQHTISHYTREAGVRQLERELGKLARKVARKVATEEVESLTVTEENVADLLGRPKIHPERAAAREQVGIATGLYYTPAGGDIMFVEAQTMAGKGNLVLTGQLGDVMKESARAAWSFALSRAGELGIDEHMGDKDVHIHVPAGAVPKDGPSAGVTMATALVSSLTGLPVRNDLAMTGELTLSGRVLPIGGVKEKVLGAVRAGITTIIMPQENERDLEDIPPKVLETLTIYPVEDLNQVLAYAIPALDATGLRAPGDGTARHAPAPPS